MLLAAVTTCDASAVIAVVPLPVPVFSSRMPVLSHDSARPFVALPAVIVLAIRFSFYNTTHRQPFGTVITISDVIVVDDTDCEVPTVYVPAPPDPVPKAVIVVPDVTPDPASTDPTVSTPAATAVIVKVVPAILPVPENDEANVSGPVDMAFLLEVIV